MNVGQSFSYMFKDGSWFYKVFLGGLFVMLSAIAVGIPFIVGYQVRHVRKMSARGEETLPEWKNIAGMFKEGATVLCALALYLAVLLAAVFAAGAAFSLTLLCIATSVVAFLWMPLVVIQFAKKTTFAACFALASLVSPMRKHLAAFAATIGITFGVMIAVFALGWMSLIIGWPFVIFWGIAVQTHVFGQLARLQ